ncbi:MAG: ThuA domain-containing protein [Halieaceae bacterium]
MRWLKVFVLGMAALLLLAMLGVYFYLRAIGIVPRAIYETEPPVLPDFGAPAILVLTKANGFVHEAAIPAADAAFAAIAEEQGWELFITDNAASHNSEDLKKFKLVIWNNVSGDVLTADQRQALKGWIESGGGWLGVHGAGGDFSYDWDWYVEALIGTQFIGHPMDPQFQSADVLVAEPENTITAHIPSPWRIDNEEWYAFATNPRELGYEILLTIDESSYVTRGETMLMDDNMDGEHPLAWRHQLGQGRVLYSAIGHQAATYEMPVYRRFLAEAMRWALDKSP